MRKTTAPKQMKMLCAVRNFFSLSSSQARPLHHRGLFALSGATMVDMRRISAKSSHLEKFSVNFLLTIYYQIFPKWPTPSLAWPIPPHMQKVLIAGRRRMAQAVFPIGPSICKFSPTSSGRFFALYFSQNPGGIWICLDFFNNFSRLINSPGEGICICFRWQFQAKI